MSKIKTDTKEHQNKSSIVTSIVIDDDVDVLDTFCAVLQTKGVDVLGKGHNGKVAVELYERLRPDLVFLDLMMPEYDGIYALDNIRKIDPTSKIIIAAAYVGEEAEQKLAALKPTRVLIKPIYADKINQLLAHNVQNQLR